MSANNINDPLMGASQGVEMTPINFFNLGMSAEDPTQKILQNQICNAPPTQESGFASIFGKSAAFKVREFNCGDQSILHPISDHRIKRIELLVSILEECVKLVARYQDPAESEDFYRLVKEKSHQMGSMTKMDQNQCELWIRKKMATPESLQSEIHDRKFKLKIMKDATLPVDIQELVIKSFKFFMTPVEENKLRIHKLHGHVARFVKYYIPLNVEYSDKINDALISCIDKNLKSISTEIETCIKSTEPEHWLLQWSPKARKFDF
jgi:hypothetical protein